MAGKSLPKLLITDRQYNLLTQYGRKYTAKTQEVKRLQIIIKSSEGQSKYSISKEIGMCHESVATWYNRWSKGYKGLLAYEKGKTGQGVSDKELLEKMLSILKDRSRPGAPVKFTLSQKQQLVALACRKPSKYGIKINRWTHEKLAQVAVSEEIVESISVRQVGNILKK